MERENNKKQLTDLEFDILDELYFVTAFKDLTDTIGDNEASVKSALKELLNYKLVKQLYPDPDSELDFDPVTFDKHCAESYYLATKAGLLFHNSR